MAKKIQLEVKTDVLSSQNLQTENKTIVGAINEVNSTIGDIDTVLERLTVGTGAN